MEYRKIVHDLAPVYDCHSKILILGSLPSVKSRGQFFYNHPQNRFWNVLEQLTNTEPLKTFAEKRAFLFRHRIAIWDVIASCEIKGSSDSSIRNVVPNDLSEIMERAEIAQIYTNGRKAFSLYRKYLLPITGREAILLPSTSPANAAYTMERLLPEWEKIMDFIG